MYDRRVAKEVTEVAFPLLSSCQRVGRCYRVYRTAVFYNPINGFGRGRRADRKDGVLAL